jgi:hypothetical protein
MICSRPHYAIMAVPPDRNRSVTRLEKFAADQWHRDLDLAVNAADLGRCLAALEQLGYAAETDWLPSRIELRAPGDRWVDVHSVAFGSDGSGRQADLDGGFFGYPPDVFGRRGLLRDQVLSRHRRPPRHHLARRTHPRCSRHPLDPRDRIETHGHKAQAPEPNPEPI